MNFSSSFLLTVAMLATNKVNASTKTSRKWKLDIKEDGMLEWWRTIVGASNVTTQKGTIHASHEKEISYQNIPFLLWNKALGSTGTVALITLKTNIAVFLCLYISHMFIYKRHSCILHFELFLNIKMVHKTCYWKKHRFKFSFLSHCCPFAKIHDLNYACSSYAS